jgi:hypothetical protein
MNPSRRLVALARALLVNFVVEALHMLPRFFAIDNPVGVDVVADCRVFYNFFKIETKCVVD